MGNARWAAEAREGVSHRPGETGRGEKGRRQAPRAGEKTRRGLWCSGLSAAIRRMNLPLPTPTMRRLTIVKYLHTQALEQESKGGPLAGLVPRHSGYDSLSEGSG